MKKRISFIALLLIVLGLLFFSTGGKITSIMLMDYSISEDGNVLTMEVGVASSIGFIRTFKAKQDENKTNITFYSTYGFNSSIGSKSEFQIDLEPFCNEIYFYSGDGNYKLKLMKNSETNEWERVKQ